MDGRTRCARSSGCTRGRCRAAWVEEKRTSLVWHYRRADPEFGEWKANQLAEELGAMTANTPVQVRQGRKIVEAVSAQVSKGAAVARCMREEGYALALCAGDDVTDESMFIPGSSQSDNGQNRRSPDPGEVPGERPVGDAAIPAGSNVVRAAPHRTLVETLLAPKCNLAT